MFLNLDLIGKQESIELFNNIGILDKEKGRLTVWLDINHTPRIHWEFEFASGDYSFIVDSPKILTSWEGSELPLILEKATITSQSPHRKQKRGYAEKVSYGDINAEAHYFEFYLPNTDFLKKATGTQLKSVKEALKTESFKVKINDHWSIELITTQDAINWLEPKSQNRGSMVTSKIILFQTQQESREVSERITMSLADANKLISDLCLMLSFVNGGYIMPVYGIAKKFQETGKDKLNLIKEINKVPIEIKEVAALSESHLISPQEDIGQGFIRNFGINDLLDFIKCFPTFQRMLQDNHWQEKWFTLLEWYFQAIPRPSGRRRNVLLPVVANALGTLLENLALLILVKDKNVSAGKSLREKIKNLLGHLGVPSKHDMAMPKDGVLVVQKNVYIIDYFVKIRNNSTHAETESIPLTEDQQ